MKKLVVFVLALVMALAALPAAGASAAELPEITYSEHLTEGSDEGYAYDVTDASIAWVKQASGALVWVPADDNRSDEEIVAQAKDADASLENAVSSFAVLKGLGTANTPNQNGSKAVVTVKEVNDTILLTIDGKYSHFVSGGVEKEEPAEEPDVEPEYEPEEDYGEEPTYAADPADLIDTEESTEADGQIRIDAPKKMAVAFEDGTVYYGGEMKDVEFGKEYAFQMCSVNWDNGEYGENNGLCGTVVYRMIVVHRSEFLALAREARANTERYVVKGMDVIDTVDKTITVNGDAEDAHLETDVNSFFVAYRFHFAGEDQFDKKTGIAGVINTPLESLSVNLPLGSTITCNAYVDGEMVATDDVYVTVNNGEGDFDDDPVYFTSVNDYTWNIEEIAR